MDIKVGSKYKVNDRKYFKNKHPKNFFNTEHIITCTEINEGLVCFVSEDGDEGLTYLDNEIISRLDLVGELKMKTGAELKARREELKITQQDLADEIGVSRTQLSRMENGKIEIPIEIRPVLYDSLYTKHEQPKLKFSDLEVGDYVYVRDDLVEFKEYGNNSYVNEIGAGHGCITNINNYQFEINNTGYYATPEMIDLSRSMKKDDYLKMNEKEVASFEELQYVANKALDESIIEKYEVSIGSYGNKNMIIHFDGKFTEYSDNSTNSGIEFIQSLYTEEFIIECKDDCKKIKQMAEITFLNGNSVVMDQPPSDDGIVRIWNDGRYDFTVLKGATVKQSKGSK